MLTDERIVMMYAGIPAFVYYCLAGAYGMQTGNKWAVLLVLFSCGAAVYAPLRKSYEARRPEASFRLPIARGLILIAHVSGVASFGCLAGVL